MKTQKSPKINTLRVRLTDHAMAKLQAYALEHSRTVSTVIREYVRRLPNPKETF